MYFHSPNTLVSATKCVPLYLRAEILAFSVNSDGFTPLDIAVMILDISMAKLLQSYGARESTRFRTKESKFSQLISLVKEAERCVDDLTTCVLSAATSGSLSMALLKEKEKQLTLWRRRQQLLWRMKSGFEKIKTPNSPASVALEVVGTKALKVKFTEDGSAREPETIVTKYKDILFGNTLETPQQQRRQVRKSIKSLFTPTPKFQKTMKRGVYLACLMYTDHRVLVTTEDTLPVMEVDESCPSCLHNDFHWLMKSALGVQDLGQFYYKPIKDLDDTTVLCTVKHVPDSKSFNNLSLRWVPLAKLQRKLSINNETCHDAFSINSLLLSATQLPTFLPTNKVRENPHVSAIYDREVIELNTEVSLILLLPPVDSVCSAPGQKDDVTERTDCVLLPLQIFEMIHMSTYQHTFISRYSRISSILEMDTLVAQHIHRQAFSTTELASAKSRLRQLQQFQTQVDNTWRSMRWLMDVLNFAREKNSPGGLMLNNFLIDKADSPSTSPPQSPQHSQSLHTLQVPTEVPGLRSFPGPIPPSIRITNSSSSFSLTESKNNADDSLKPNAEIRRCASTSRLICPSSSTDEPDNDDSYEHKKPPSSLQLIDDKSKAYSTEALSVTYKIGACSSPVCDSSAAATPVNEDEESSDKGQGDDDTLSHEGIVINVLPGRGSSHSLSSNEGTNPESDEFDDDISDYKEQQMDVLLQLPQDESKDHNSDDEDSLTDCGLQFKAISGSGEGSSNQEDEDYTFVTSVLDSGHPCPETNFDVSVDELRISVAYHDSIPADTSVRLQVSPEVSVREIVEAVIGQMNDATLEEKYDSTLYIDDQTKDNLCMVVSFGTLERSLSDSFQPLKVQNPWTKGHLFVKRKSDVCTSQPEQ
ncbi:Ankyrin repeat and fibronectin type-III like protein [Argiope bruennichi]|uniref:Ankyrin repeat and fibronectin type-III like protein n=1 Tax=Argiope bruennichi TaxID=94029 RepID=A0A8T0EX74_ARGBR|nr:Ankyrin repeat and fibronectin type-III like protein [Argiope bruennichi]